MKLLYSLLLLMFCGCGAVQSSQPAMASVVISTTTLPNGVINVPYSAAVKASGGCLPNKWLILSGTLPVGLTATPILNTTSYKISGTPTVAAAYTFTVQVKGCGGSISTKTYTVTIQQPNHTVALNWNASTSPNILSYNVYRSAAGGPWSVIANVAATDYVDGGVANGVTYSYAATAVDTSNQQSAYSNQVAVTIP